MISTSIRATWSRACCSVLTIGALTASVASADLRTSRVALDRTASAGSVMATQPVDASTYQARIIFGDGSPVTEQIAITDGEGRFLQRVVPSAEGLIRISGQAGQKFGVVLPNGGDLTVSGTTLNGGIALTEDSGMIIDVVVSGTSSGQADVLHNSAPAPSASGNFTGVNLGSGALNPAMVVNQGGPLCDTAVPIAIGASDAGTTVGSPPDNTGATFCGTGGGGPLVWYSVVGNGNRLTAETCVGTPLDSKLWVFRQCGTPCNAGTLTCLGGNDDACGGGLNFQSRVAWDSVAGVTYKIAVGGFGGASGPYTLTVLNGAAANGQACPLPTGSCCITSDPPFSQNEVPVACQIENEPDCVALGGTYNGDDSPCITGTISFAEYEDTPVPAIPIPDGTGPLPSPGPSVNRTITVVPVAVVADVNVEVDSNHPFNGDLNVFIHHNGDTVRIWNNVCGNAGLHYTSDGEGTNTLCAPIGTGTGDTDGDGWPSDGPDVRPQDVFPVNSQFIEVFDNGPCEGAWDFEILDNWAAFTGSLQHWGLELTCLTDIQNACADAECGDGGGCADPSGHTLLCHIPPGNPDNAHEIVVGNAAVPAHLAHGDECGPCSAP